MEIRKGDIVADSKGQTGSVMGVSEKGRATVRLDDGTVIAIDVVELKKVPSAPH